MQSRYRWRSVHGDYPVIASNKNYSEERSKVERDCTVNQLKQNRKVSDIHLSSSLPLPHQYLLLFLPLYPPAIIWTAHCLAKHSPVDSQSIGCGFQNEVSSKQTGGSTPVTMELSWQQEDQLGTGKACIVATHYTALTLYQPMTHGAPVLHMPNTRHYTSVFTVLPPFQLTL